jgi:hypothetical protein
VTQYSRPLFDIRSGLKHTFNRGSHVEPVDGAQISPRAARWPPDGIRGAGQPDLALPPGP